MSTQTGVNVPQTPTLLKRVKALAAVLALALTGGMLAAVPVAQAADSTITVSYQNSDAGFELTRQQLSVHPGLAAEYGYSYHNSVPSTALTALDALVAAHIKVFGSDVQDINDALALSGSGFITTSFYGDGSGVMTFVNGQQPSNGIAAPDAFNGGESYFGYGVTQAVIKPGDLVEFFTTQDPSGWGMDYVAWFSKDGGKVEGLTVAPGEQVNLSVRGFMGWYGLSVPSWQKTKTENIESAAVVPVSITDAGGWNTGIFDKANPLAISDSDGRVSFKFDNEGTYYVSAYQSDVDELPIFSPWLKVTVAASAVAKPTPVAKSNRITFNANGGTVSTKGKTVKT
ncbi:MAG: hypothetical protein LBU38_01620, partial [Propionibacteriaceae bacterium]|nr:hypothetical protein [Propionibacteriaceae bacterium]